MEFKTTQIVILLIFIFVVDFARKKSKIPSGENQHEKSEASCKPAMEMTFINMKTQDTRLRAICRGNSDLAIGKQYFCRLNSTPKELDKGGFGSQHFPRLLWGAWVRTTFLDSSQVTLENCLFLISKFFWVLVADLRSGVHVVFFGGGQKSADGQRGNEERRTAWSRFSLSPSCF